MGILGFLAGSVGLIVGIVGLLIGLIIVLLLLGPIMIGSDEIGVVEKKFGPSLKDGALIALNKEAGFQADILRTGLHFKSRIIYRIHKCSLITIKQGEIGYVFSRDGQSLETDQALGRQVDCNSFQNVRMFIENGGQKGPQRMILREGTYAFNLAQFIVMTKDKLYQLAIGSKQEQSAIENMRTTLISREGFTPVVIDSEQRSDSIGIVVTFEGQSLDTNDIIAPIVGTDGADKATFHNSFQNIEAFLRAGGYKGRQYQVLTEGTFFINRLFATVEYKEKTEIGISHVGVVNSYVGKEGDDLSGEEYTHGELVANGCKGIWKEPLHPGKYAFNTYAGEIIKVPTDNFSLKWKNGETGQYGYDKNLRELSVITKDGFQPLIPLSIIVHINYREAPFMIQRFGSVEKVVEQSLDTIISSYFKQVAEQKTFLEILQQKTAIANEVEEKMRVEFKRLNLDLEGVLIDTPRANGDKKIDALIEQLSERQLSEEKVKTYVSKMKATEQERQLKEKEAMTEKQSDLTTSKVQIEVDNNNAEAKRRVSERAAEQLKIETDAQAYQTQKVAEVEATVLETRTKAESKKIEMIAQAEATKVKVAAEADASSIKLNASAEAEKITLLGDAQAHKEREVGFATAEAIAKQVEAYGGASLMVQKDIALAYAEAIKDGKISIVPENLIMSGNGEHTAMPNGLEQLIGMSLLEKMKAQTSETASSGK